MKKYLFLIACLSVLACKKDNASPADCDQLLTLTTEYSTSTYTYDGQGRLLKGSHSNGNVVSYTYPDQHTVITTEKNVIQTITLNSRNEVVRREIRYSNGLIVNMIYGFGENGVPIELKFEEYRAGEDQPFKTTTYEVDCRIDNGNLFYFSLKDIATGEKEVMEFTYDLSLPNIIPRSRFYTDFNPHYDEGFKSKNLPVTIRLIPSGQQQVYQDISYEYDTKGRIIKRINTHKNGPPNPSVQEYKYMCN